MDKITVLLPTDGKKINGLNYQIDAVLNQSHKNLELVVLSSYADLDIKRDDPRFKVVRVPEEFWGYWGHKAVRWAVYNLELDGDWLYVLGDDDVLCEWGLEKLIASGEGNDMVIGKVVALNRVNHNIGMTLGADLACGHITGSCCLYRLSRVKEVDYTEDQYEADWILIKAMMKFPYKQIDSLVYLLNCL